MLDHIKEANRTWSYHPPSFVSVAKLWLLKTEFTVQASDKDGVFVLLTHEELRYLQALELTKPCYWPVSQATYEVEHSLAVRISMKLATKLDKLGHDS